MRGVLLVDDDRGWTEAMLLYLQLYGIAGVAAGNGEQGWQLLQEGFRPSVIVLDLMMPVVDGTAFRSRQLAQPDLAAIPIIVCSAGFDARRAAERLGARAFIEKPVRPSDLLRLIQDLSDTPSADV